MQTDPFPSKMEIAFIEGESRQVMFFEKMQWEIDGKTMGLRYGENPGQEAALYELKGGNLTLGECQFISPENGLVSALDESMLVQFSHDGIRHSHCGSFR